MVSRVYTYLQTHQVMCVKYMQLFICQSHLNKVIFKCEKKKKKNENPHALLVGI